jgi:hypothetical protein
MNSIPIQPDTTTTIHHRRPVLPVLSLLVAGAAVTLAAVAIATDDAGSSTPQSSPLVAAAAIELPSPWWADPAQHPANQDPPLSANQSSAAAITAAKDHPANGSADTTGDGTAWWAERR